MNDRQRRIWEAQRAGLVARLRDSLHIPDRRIETLLAAWQEEARGRGLEPDTAGYWATAETWLAEHLGPPPG